MPTHKPVPHITVAIAPGAKPVQSNHITDWKDVSGDLVLFGHVVEFK